MVFLIRQWVPSFPIDEFILKLDDQLWNWLLIWLTGKKLENWVLKSLPSIQAALTIAISTILSKKRNFSNSKSHIADTPFKHNQMEIFTYLCRRGYYPWSCTYQTNVLTLRYILNSHIHSTFKAPLHVNFSSCHLLLFSKYLFKMVY